ncbi:Uridine kinase [uncultured archaeon]|nr:Uridine kinase [uncultured archaeon]
MGSLKKHIGFKDRILKSKKIFIIGVAGDSGSGKTTFVKGIQNMFGSDMVCNFSLDDYHSLDRDGRAKRGITALNPEANNLEQLYQDLVKLKKRESIMKPVYEHATGTFGKPVKFDPKPIIIIEGLMPFYTDKLREVVDFKIFVDPERSVKRKWKIKRDVKDRGHKMEEVMKEIIAREPDYKKFIDFEKIYAEVVIKIRPTKFADVLGESDNVSIRLIQRLLDIPLENLPLGIDLAKLLGKTKTSFSLDFEGGDYYGYDVSKITIDGTIPEEVLEELQERILEFIGNSSGSIFSSECNTATDLTQLLITWRFLEKIDNILKN